MLRDILRVDPPFTKFNPDPRRPSPSAAVGIEIELEGIDYSEFNSKYWRLARDGSLRNGVELVSIPLRGKQIASALNYVRRYFNTHPCYISFRTSVHVHLDVSTLEIDHLKHLLKLYLLYEPALFRLNPDWNRYDNIFCVPARKSYAIQEGYATLLRDLDANQIRTDYVGYKYSALNPNSINRFGTLEFRHMGGTDDVSNILRWIDVLLQLKKSAIDMCNPKDPSEVFGEYVDQVNILPEDIQDGLYMLDHIEFINQNGV